MIRRRTFKVGELVCVSDGPFARFRGTVDEVDEARSRIKLTVSIFGRPTPVELNSGRWRSLGRCPSQTAIFRRSPVGVCQRDREEPSRPGGATAAIVEQVFTGEH